MSKKSLLNHEELDYIQQILGNSLAISGLAAPSFRVDGGAAANAVLASLGKHAELHLDAQLGDQHLRFPLQLVEDEFHALHLELGAPKIFQHGDVQRSWRLNLEQPLFLLDQDGALSELCVHEISPSGVLIEATGSLNTPETFTLWLPLPGQEPIKLRGNYVRRINPELSAFRLDLLPVSHGERLRHFIFQQHRLQHPQLQQRA
jgi:hypothetical protein